MHSASWFNIYQYQVQCNSLHSSMWPYLYFYKWIRCYFLWVAMFLCYCFLAIVNTLKSLLGKINHWHRNMHLFSYRCLRPYNSEHLKSEIIKKAHCHSGPASLKNMSQNGNLPQIGVIIKNIWNHHLEMKPMSKTWYLVKMKQNTIFHRPWQHSSIFSTVTVWACPLPGIRDGIAADSWSRLWSF